MPKLVIDQSRRCANIEGQEIQLSPQEYRLLHRLACSIDQVVTREELVRTIWSMTDPNQNPIIVATPATVDLVVFRLRKKLGDRPTDPIYLETRRGFGYILHNAQIVAGSPVRSDIETDNPTDSAMQTPASSVDRLALTPTTTPWSVLTRREWELFLLLSEERSIHLTNKALAQHLRMAEGTLKKHLQNIYRKLGVENRSGAMLLAMRTKVEVGR